MLLLSGPSVVLKGRCGAAACLRREEEAAPANGGPMLLGRVASRLGSGVVTLGLAAAAVQTGAAVINGSTGKSSGGGILASDDAAAKVVECKPRLPHPSPGIKPDECGRRGPNKKVEATAIFAGSAGKHLAQSICDKLRHPLGVVDVSRFTDGEVALRFRESVRGKEVYLIQPTGPPVNENLMELLFMISTLRRSSAKKITAVIPYYGYARQDRKMNSRVPISAADVARMIEVMGADRVISVDLHSGQIQGFFGPTVPVDNLQASIVGLRYFQELRLNSPVVVSPDAGGVYRARNFQGGLTQSGVENVGFAMLIKQRVKANEIERMDLVGDVKGRDVIIVDDMIDTAGTLCEAAQQLKEHGANRVYCFATHGLFSGPAIERIRNSALEEVVTTDSILLHDEARKCDKITQLSIAQMLADVIQCIQQKESIAHIFTPPAGAP